MPTQEERLLELSEGIGEARLAREEKRHLAPWAPVYAPRVYDERLNLYNAHAENSRQIAAGRARARNGGNMHGLFLWDSTGVGTGAAGVTATERKSVPKQLQRLVSEALNVPIAGGISPATAASGLRSDRWSGTGAITAFYAFLTSGQTHIYTTLHKGPNVDLYISELGSAGTYSIDGEAPVNIAVGNGTNTVRKISRTGLSDTTHVITFTGSGGAGTWLLVLGGEVWSPHGTRFHNLSMGGSRAGGASDALNWTDTVSSSAVYGRKRMFDASGITPDFVCVDLGANDISAANSTATIIAALEVMHDWYPNADFILSALWEKFDTETDEGIELMTARYELAKELDCWLFDWRHRHGDRATAQTAGLLSSDNIHFHDGTGEDLAHSMSIPISGDGPGHPRLVTQPYASASYSHLPAGTLVAVYDPAGTV